eukprot:m51a1_g5654 putative poly [ADP-ribose] polymerase (2347) ;mRNA; r:873460-881811
MSDKPEDVKPATLEKHEEAAPAPMEVEKEKPREPEAEAAAPAAEPESKGEDTPRKRTSKSEAMAREEAKEILQGSDAESGNEEGASGSPKHSRRSHKPPAPLSLKTWQSMECMPGDVIAVRCDEDDEEPFYLAVSKGRVSPGGDEDIPVQWLELAEKQSSAAGTKSYTLGGTDTIPSGALICRAVTRKYKDTRTIAREELSRIEKIVEYERKYEGVGGKSPKDTTSEEGQTPDQATEDKKPVTVEAKKKGPRAKAAKSAGKEDSDAEEYKESSEDDEVKPSSSSASDDDYAPRKRARGAATAKKPVDAAKEEKRKKAARKRARKGPAEPRPDMPLALENLALEGKAAQPACCAVCKAKDAIRLVRVGDTDKLKAMAEDVKGIYSLFVSQSAGVEDTALDVAIKTNNCEAIRVLGQELKDSKSRASSPQMGLAQLNTGTYSKFALGHAVRQLQEIRGARQGNAALTEDNSAYSSSFGTNCVYRAAATAMSHPGVTNECLEALVAFVPNFLQVVADKIVYAIERGYRQRAAFMLAQLKELGGWGFNFLHEKALSADDITEKPLRAASVTKKPQWNRSVTPIHCAAINPSTRCLKALFAVVPEYGILDERRRRPIHYAAASEDPAPLQYLLENRADFRDGDDHKITPLMLAAEYGRLKNVELLIRYMRRMDEENAQADAMDVDKEAGGSADEEHEEEGSEVDSEADDEEEDEAPKRRKGAKAAAAAATTVLAQCLSAKDSAGQTALLHAVIGGNSDIVKILIDNGASAGIERVRKESVLHAAVSEGCSTDVIRYLVTEVGLPVDPRDKFKKTPLMMAVMNGDARATSLLLKLGADVDAMDSSENSVCHYAAAYGWLQCLKMLVDLGADVNATNIWKLTPLAVAMLKGHFACADYLLSREGVNVNSTDENGMTLLARALASNLSEEGLQQIRFLVEKKGASVTVSDLDGNTPLHHLLSTGETQEDKQKAICEALELLVAHGADLNAVNKAGQTPLMLAAESPACIPAVLALLKRGAKIMVSPANGSSRGSNLLHVLAKNCVENKEDMSAVLEAIKNNPDLEKAGNQVDKEGFTPLLRLASVVSRFSRSDKPEKMQRVSDFAVGFVSVVKPNPSQQVVAPDEFFAMKAAVNQDSSDSSDSSGESESECDSDASAARRIETENQLNNEASSASPPSEVTLTDEQMKNPFLSLTALHFLSRGTISKCSLDLARAVLDLKPKLSLQDLQSRTPLHSALRNSWEELAVLLIKAHAPHLSLDSTSSSPLILAAQEGFVGAARAILEALPNDAERSKLVHVADKKQRTALHYAVQTKVEIVQELLRAGASVNALDVDKRSPLHFAVNSSSAESNTSFDVISELLEAKASINSQDTFGRTPLHYAFVKMGERRNSKSKVDPIEVLQVLCTVDGVQVDIPDTTSKRTPLHYAASKGASVSSFFLCSKGANLESEDADQNTPLGVAILSGFSDFGLMLVQRNANACHALHIVTETRTKSLDGEVKVTRNDREISLFRHAIENDWQGVCHMLLEAGFPIFRALHDALEAGKLVMASSLARRLKLKHVDDTSPQAVQTKRNYLHSLSAGLAAVGGKPLDQVFPLLEALGCKVDATDCDGRTPLHLAAMNHHVELCKKLLQAGAKVDLGDARGSTALGLAIHNSSSSTIDSDALLETAALLLSSGASCESPFVDETARHKKRRSTPLTYAIRKRGAKLVKLLLDNKACAGTADSEGRTPLMHAVRKNDMEAAKLLVDIDSDVARVNAADSEGKTALHHVVSPCSIGSYENKELLELLVSHGCKTATKDASGHTAYYYAMMQESGRMARYLRDLGHAERFLNPPTRAVSTLTDWAGHNIDFEEDAEDALREAAEGAEPAAAPPAEVDPEAKAALSAPGIEVVAGPDGKPCDVLLNKVDIRALRFGVNLFYRVQLLRIPGNNSYILWTRWGRVGDDGNHQQTPIPDIESAMREFNAVVRQKSAKYRRVVLETKKSAKELLKPFSEEDLKKRSPILSPGIKDLFKQITDMSYMRSAMGRCGINTDLMPLGRLNRNTIDEAKAVLAQLKDAVEKHTEASNLTPISPAKVREAYEVVTQLSSKYYELIPHGQYRTEQMPPIDDLNALRRAEGDIDSLLNLEAASKVLLGAQTHAKDMNPLEYCYRALEMFAEELPAGGAEAKAIRQYATSTSSATVRYVLKVQRKGEPERMAPFRALENHYLLWHGTRTENYIGILLQGLRVSPAEAVNSGAMFGRGIYFADMLRKSQGYGGNIYMLCEVALGKMLELTDAEYMEAPHEGYNSTKGLGSEGSDFSKSLVMPNGVMIPTGKPYQLDYEERDAKNIRLSYNEYIVYNPAQVRIRYLVVVE